MKKQIASLTLLLALVTGFVLADEAEYNQLFDEQTVQTLAAKVVSIDRGVELEPGMEPAVVAMVQTKFGKLQVHIGPQWFTEPFREEWNIQSGDQVQITGSIVEFQGQKTMMLTAGQKGEKRMVLRDTSGSPVWDTEDETPIW